MLFDFNHIRLPTTPNYCIVAPAKHYSKRWQQPKIYNVPKQKLKTAWQQVIAKAPRVEIIKTEHNQVEYAQYSRIFKFKDSIFVQFNEVDANTSSLYIYSKSNTGYWDFGVNCKRVHNWLAQLNTQVSI